MADTLSKTQIDRLGDRIKKGDLSEADLRLLDEYRRSYAPAYETVVSRVRNELALEPTGRPAKSTSSVIDKLRRESIRLTQIQDIAGCRLTVLDIEAQEGVLTSLLNLFPGAHVSDRRNQPSHGYRAVHVIASCDGKLVEIQLRTSLQHSWAELSEKFSDVIDQSIKYGGGDSETRNDLDNLSELIDNVEMLEKGFITISKNFPADPELSNIKSDIDDLRQTIRSDISQIANSLDGTDLEQG